jgi:hypothetical protein
VTLIQCSPRLMGRSCGKVKFFEWRKRFKEDRENAVDEFSDHHFLRYQGYCSLRIHSTRPNSQLILLCGNTEAVREAVGRKMPEL